MQEITDNLFVTHRQVGAFIVHFTQQKQINEKKETLNFSAAFKTTKRQHVSYITI